MSSGEETIVPDQNEKIAKEMTHALCKYCKDLANKIIEDYFREKLEHFIMDKIIKKLQEKIGEEEEELNNIN